MKYLRVLLLFFAASFAVEVEEEVRFYRSEEDFRRGIEVSRNRLGQSPFLEVVYDEFENVLFKRFYRKINSLTEFEEFTYDPETNSLMEKSVYTADSTLIRRFLFGPGEEMSERFIRYIYGVEQLKEFEDRFTAVDYVDGIHPIVYRFFDIDAFLYGLINLTHGSNEGLRQEDWLVMPGERLMRRYLYGHDSDNGTTEIWEYDSTDALVMNMTVGADGRAPLFTVSFPTDSSSTKSPEVAYSLINRLKEGRVIWEWESGKPDTMAPHTSNMVDAEMTRGVHESGRLRFSPNLVDSAIYRIRFEGVGELGYPAKEIEIQHVKFDTTAPYYTIRSEPFVNKPQVSFSLEEDLSSAEVMWIWERGERDARSPHSVGLSKGFLKEGEHAGVSFEEEIQLNNGTVYTVVFGGKDDAGNLGPVVSVRGVVYDSVPPQFTWVKPDTGAPVSSSGVSYVLNELLSGGEMVWRQVSGTVDPISPQVVSLNGGELKAGKHQYVLLQNAPKLVDGAIYELRIHGVDRAGNVSDTLFVSDVTYDLTPPVLTVQSPKPGQPARNSEMAYTLSEDFAAARIEWQKITEDSVLPPEPRIVFLDSTHLGQGDHRVVHPGLSTAFEEGFFYRLTVTGRDLAGNEAIPVGIDSVLLDASPPVFTNLYPTDSSYVSSDTLSYTLSENLVAGEVIWTQVDGEFDSGSPHTVTLVPFEKNRGEHQRVVLAASPLLNDRSIYDVSFTGEDAAGNRAEETVVRHIVFDMTPPEIRFVFPAPRSAVPTPEVSYLLSESLKEGSITWERSGGSEDDHAPHVVPLTGEELEPGTHERILLSHSPALVEGGIYSITIRGKDFGDISSAPDEITTVRFDPTPPNIAVRDPSEESHVNTPTVLYSLSESLSEGTIVWTRSGGNEDVRSPHTVRLIESELEAGDHGEIPQINSPTLTSGSVYDVAMFGQDSAGNLSDTLLVSNIFFDRTPPAFEISYPIAYTPSSTMGVAYELSEPLSEGRITWKWTGGSVDEDSIRAQIFTGDELAAGEHPESILSSKPPILAEGGIYTVIFDGKDLAGNDAISVQIPDVLYDAIAPIFSDLHPDSGAQVNSNHLSYSLSETVDEGKVIWRWTGGQEDPGSPHVVQLAATEMDAGFHESVELANAPVLNDSSVYDIYFSGRDGAGNASDTVVVSNVLYDVTPPRIELTFPAPETYVSKPAVSYVVNEDLSEGSVTWERTAGSEDPNSPHVRSFTGEQLLQGDHTEIQFEESPALSEGSLYTVSIAGKDRAGNRADPVVISQVGFDNQSPEFADVFPAHGSWVNDPQVAYNLSESLESGTVRWIQVGGAGDPNSPHMINLQGEELSVGSYPLSQLAESPSLADSALYTVEFFGIDAAGNASDTIRIDSVGYDVTVPDITVSLLSSESYLSSATVSYFLSEPLTEGTVRWTRTGGTVDESAPNEFTFSDEQLEMGEHSHVPPDQFRLQDGATYTLTLEGKDRAGNLSRPVVLQDLIVDGTAPEIADFLPADSTFINHKRISYTLSEPLTQGLVSWVRISGSEDPDSPHHVELIDREMNVGQHDDVVLANEAALQDGSVYSISFSGSDAAGNESDTVTVSQVTYDISPPGIELVYPGKGGNISSSRVKYELSENLEEGSVTWAWTEGEPDASAPHTSTLTDSLLWEGEHDERFAQEPPLVDGAVYSLKFSGVDAAGNSAEPVIISPVTYDAKPPVITLTDPGPGAHINGTVLSYSLSEDMEAATITWRRMDGNPDPTSPHEVDLTMDELVGGEHAEIVLRASPELRDGSVYTLTFAGVDYGGNASDTVEVRDITFDVTPAAITLTNPQADTYVNTIAVSYSLTESLREGTVVWQWMSGFPDRQSIHTVILSGASLDSGEHADWEASPPPELVDGAAYSISLTGIDSAGNSSEGATVQGVTFDRTSPALSVDSPVDSSYRNHSRLSYRLSETLQNAKAIWIQVGGTSDGAAPHELELTGEELTTGGHPDQVLAQPVDLKDGAIYDLKVTGIDRAGNEADTLLIRNIAYDLLPPTYQILEPTAGSYVNSSTVRYRMDENLKEATLRWNRIEGTGDPQSPHVIDVPDEMLSAGEDTTAESLPLMNNAVYALTFQGTDMAGNDGEIITVTEVTFDDIDPIVTLTAPENRTSTNSDLISYTLSEELAGGNVSWSLTGGTPDPASPHEAELTGDQLQGGEHTEVQLAQRPVLQDGAAYDIRFQGVDLADNAAREAVLSQVTYDTTAPVISLVSPQGDTAVNSTVLTYELSENLQSGTITWQRPEGSPHESNLIGNELASGLHENILLTEEPELADGSNYSITVDGVDMAGNSANSVSVQNVTFDVSPPVIVANFPAPSSGVNTTRVSYSLSESLTEGTLTWTRTGGSEDPGSPHVQPLIPSEMTVDDHQDIFLASPPELVNDAAYSLEFDGSDRAGNRASGMIIESVTFDSVKPVLALTEPGDGTHINEPRISYDLSEGLHDGRITWTRESGNEDPVSPHIIELTESELSAGEHAEVITTTLPQLQDGTVYSISLTGTDIGGNSGDSITVAGIVFDSSPPIISLDAPGSNTFANSAELTYSTSEELGEATVTWTAIGGTSDPVSPHSIVLTTEELAEGIHEGIVLANQTDLADGSIYTVELSGSDLAGNEAPSLKANGIHFDTSRPRFAQIEPVSGSYINKMELSYTLSETLSIGQITVSRISGMEDPGSPYTVELKGEELFAGRRESFAPPGLGTLVSGASYSVEFSGTDRAGNGTDTLGIETVVFDDTSPVFTVISPETSAYLSHSRISYGLSETISAGTVSWAPTDGGTPLVQSLVGSELEEGPHDNIDLADSPDLLDGTVYDIRFEGGDLAGNESDPAVITGVTYDVTVPKIRVTLDSEAPRTFTFDTPVTIRNSETMSEITFSWERESGAADPGSPHVLSLPEENLLEGDHSEVLLPGADALQPGTVYTLVVRGSDLAGNESRPQTVESIDIIRDLEGDWLSKTALLTAVWSFRGQEEFLQGVMMGTRISQQEPGSVSIDFSKRPFEITIEFDSGVKRYAIFEFTGWNTMRVAIGEKKPKSWSDGDLMEFEISEPEVP
ncbi:MAG: Ig-like domain-containing protein [Candidatus Neomarinimicrobiota bacterium]